MTTASNEGQSRMRLILPFPMTSAGGIDSFTCSLISEFIGLIDLVVWVLPDTDRRLERSVAQSDRLVVEEFRNARMIAGILTSLRNHAHPELLRLLAKLMLQHQLNHLISKHGITHCLVPSPQDLPALRLKTPVAAVVHD